jgi:hypothetical protein
LLADSEVGWLGVGGGGVGADCWAVAEQTPSALASVTAENAAVRNQTRVIIPPLCCGTAGAL